MMIRGSRGKMPEISHSARAAENAAVIGDVTLGAFVTLWYGAVLRGDEAPIRIGDGSNIQDNCTVHCAIGKPVTVGTNVVVGHGAILHSCTVEDGCLVGMGAVLLDGCGSAWVEAGCDAAEGEVSARLPGRFLTDRFSPGYGDLPLSLQPAICGALDTQRTLGLYVTDSCLLNPGKSVTAIVGVADRPQMARVRGCRYCSMNQTCQLRKGGKSCGLS